jgi:hypothetical protein
LKVNLYGMCYEFSIFSMYFKCEGTHGSIDGWGTVLQVRWLWVEVPMRSLNFSNLPNTSSCTIGLAFTQPLTEIRPDSLPGVKCCEDVDCYHNC